MSGERHGEIAARLRAEAGAHAPERLRADVMLRVRAEPRPRRIHPRRRPVWRPLGAVAAVACVLAALVFGLSRGTTSAPSGALSSAGAGAGRAPHSAAGPGLSTVHGAGAATSSTAKRVTRAGDNALAVRFGRLQPYALAWRAERLPPGLRRALESLALDRGRGAH